MAHGQTPPGELAASGYHVSQQMAGGSQGSPGGLAGFLAHGDVYSGFKSSNVAAAQYDPHEDYLQVGFQNGGWYGYHDVTTNEARSFYGAASKGNWVWDHLRRRGTVFGYQKPYAYIGGRSEGYVPKYYESDVAREQHRKIGRAGHVPAEWLAGKGPYDPEWLAKKAPHPAGEQYPMSGATPHPKAPRPEQARGDEDYTSRKVPKAYVPPPEIPVATHAPPIPAAAHAPAKKSLLGRLWGGAKSFFGFGQRKAGGGEVEQRLGSGGDDEPIYATPGEVVLPKSIANDLRRLLEWGDGANGHYARGGTVNSSIVSALGAQQVGGLVGQAMGGGSLGGLAGSATAGSVLPGGGQGAMMGGPVGIAVQAALAAKEQIEKVRDRFYELNEKSVNLATGFAKVAGVPDSIAQFGGSVTKLVSPLNLAGMAVGMLTDPAASAKKGLQGVADVGTSLAKVLWDMRDPAAMIAQSLAPFTGQVRHYNPGTIERFQLALDNVSAAAGRMFEPIFEEGRRFADELNILYTGVADTGRLFLGDLIPIVRDFGREFASGAFRFVRDGMNDLRPVLQDMLPLGRGVGQVFGLVFTVGSNLVTATVRVYEAYDNLTRSITGGIGIFDMMTNSLRGLVVMVDATGATLRQFMERLASPINGPAINPAQNLVDAALRVAQAAQPPQGPSTLAAQNARQVGIEQVGQEARAAAFSQGQNIQEQQLAAQVGAAADLGGIRRILEALMTGFNLVQNAAQAQGGAVMGNN